MKSNRTTTTIITTAATLIAVIALVIGFFVVAGGDDDATADPLAPADPAIEQSLTVSARDTSKQALSGVAVKLLDAGGATVATGTTGAGGTASLSFTPAAGSYVVVADEPSGYHAHDDKDGGATEVGGPPCDNVYLCVYLTVTEVRAADGTSSFTVELSHVRSDQRAELDDLWFEMTPPGAAVEDESAIAVDDPSDEILIGDPVTEEVTEEVTDDQDETDGASDPVVDELPGLRSVCADVRHAPVVEQESVSGIWVRGEVYGLQSGWIWVEGPTLNGGEPIGIPVEGGAFEGPLGINSYGDHEITGFELVGDDPATAVDLLPGLADGPGTIFPVGPGEGPVFDSECFDFPPTPVPALPPLDEQAAAAGQTSHQTAARQAAAEAQVDGFLDTFVDDHTRGDVDHLLETLHPSVPLAFGEAVCSEYVAATAGSIVGAEAISVGLPVELDLDTPNGVITFPEAIPFSVEFTLADGSTVISDANLAMHDGSARWLTRCGVD